MVFQNYHRDVKNTENFKIINDSIYFKGVTSPKVRGITKSNTMSNATGRSAIGPGNIHDNKRRSAYETSAGRDGGPGKLSGSTDKATIGLEQSDVSQAK